jgi:hypothetical protein
VLYRLFDARRVVYVGITEDLARRPAEHRRDKPWWPTVTRIGFTVCADRRALPAAVAGRGAPVAKGAGTAPGHAVGLNEV